MRSLANTFSHCGRAAGRRAKTAGRLASAAAAGEQVRANTIGAVVINKRADLHGARPSALAR